MLSVREVGGSIPGPIKSAQFRQRLVTVATFYWSCVAQALSSGYGPRHSLHTLRRITASVMTIWFFASDFWLFCLQQTAWAKIIRIGSKHKRYIPCVETIGNCWLVKFTCSCWDLRQIYLLQCNSLKRREELPACEYLFQICGCERDYSNHCDDEVTT